MFTKMGMPLEAPVTCKVMANNSSDSGSQLMAFCCLERQFRIRSSRLNNLPVALSMAG